MQSIWLSVRSNEPESCISARGLQGIARRYSTLGKTLSCSQSLLSPQSVPGVEPTTRRPSLLPQSGLSSCRNESKCDRCIAHKRLATVGARVSCNIVLRCTLCDGYSGNRRSTIHRNSELLRDDLLLRAARPTTAWDVVHNALHQEVDQILVCANYLNTHH